MKRVSALFVGLVDDAAMFPPGSAEVAEALAAHREYRRSWFAPMVGALVVSDQKLSELGRAVRRTDDLPPPVTEDLEVSVVNTSGANGLVGLAGRLPAGLRLQAVESALRDLDDLAGNASRVVAAAGELDAGVQVFVELPYAPGEAVLLQRGTGQPLFARELDVLAAERGLQVLWLPGHRRAADSWVGATGGPADDVALLRRWVPDVAERDVYVCGPQAWTASVRATLAAAGLPAARLHVETFGW